MTEPTLSSQLLGLVAIFIVVFILLLLTDKNEKSDSRDMSEMEIRVLNMIMNCATFDLPIQASEIRLETGLSKRKLEEVIESLRVNFGHPIVAKKMKPNGYYLPRSEEERQAGLAPYRRQILTEQKNLAAVMNVDLDKYWEDSA